MPKRRRHYIAEWAEMLGIANAAIIEATGADKSLVHRWLKKGSEPAQRSGRQSRSISKRTRKPTLSQSV